MRVIESTISAQEAGLLSVSLRDSYTKAHCVCMGLAGLKERMN